MLGNLVVQKHDNIHGKVTTTRWIYHIVLTTLGNDKNNSHTTRRPKVTPSFNTCCCWGNLMGLHREILVEEVMEQFYGWIGNHISP